MEDIRTLVNNEGFIKRIQYTLITLFALVIALDIYLALDSIDNNTISNVIQTYTDNGVFVLTYFWGVVAANLFFTTKNPFVNGTYGSIIIIGIALIFLIFNIEPKIELYLINHNYGISIYSISMAFGFIIGLLFWRQKHKINDMVI